VTSLAVVDAFIARIKEVNPQLNAVVANRFQAAQEEAAEVDRVLDSGSLPEELSEQNAPYLGVPVTTKEALEVAGNVGLCLMACCHIWYRMMLLSLQTVYDTTVLVTYLTSLFLYLSYVIH